jgi:hypothetical protein
MRQLLIIILPVLTFSPFNATIVTGPVTLCWVSAGGLTVQRIRELSPILRNMET